MSRTVASKNRPTLHYAPPAPRDWHQIATGPHAHWLIAGGLALLTLITFWPVAGCSFINLDDDFYVTRNRYTQMGVTSTSVIWALTHQQENLYHPLAPISFMVDYDLFGLNPAGYHLVNLLLHLLNVLILFWLLRYMTGSDWRSAAVGLVFAVHPLRVESVAWVVERKDVLGMFFGLLAIAAYARYARRPGWLRYLPIPLLFVLSLLAKPMLITLPAILLVLDFWPLRRVGPRPGAHGTVTTSGLRAFRSPLLVLRERARVRAFPVVPEEDPHSDPLPEYQEREKGAKRDSRAREESDAQTPPFPRRRFGGLLLEKVPLILLSVVSAAATMPGLTARITGLTNIAPPSAAMESSHAEVRYDPFFRLDLRLRNATVSYVRYMEKMIDVRNLSAWYPDVWWKTWQVAAAGGVVGIVTALSLGLVRTRPWLAAGWFWYCISIFPLSGIIRISTYSMADRYTYFPMIGILIAVAWSFPRRLPKSAAARGALGVVGGVLLIVMCVATRFQIDNWTDSTALWRHALEVTPDNYKAETELGNALVESGGFAEARQHFLAAEKLRPYSALIHFNLARTSQQLGDSTAALTEYTTVLTLSPNAVDALVDRGGILAERGDLAGATADHHRAVELDATDENALVNLGLDLAAAGQAKPAAEQYERALAVNPNNVDAHLNLSTVELGQGDLAGAMRHASAAASLNPRLSEAFYNLGRADFRAGNINAAIDSLRKALHLDPGNADIRAELTEAVRHR